VTSKEALQRIGEYSEAAITIRGTYFPPGKEPKEGERKIYLAIESRRWERTHQSLCSVHFDLFNTVSAWVVSYGGEHLTSGSLVRLEVVT
jgi:hypothetical protein